MLQRIHILFYLFILLFLSCLDSAATFVVDPRGNAPGSDNHKEKFSTLEAARDAARKDGNSPHRILLKDGDYFLTKSLELDVRDSGLTIEAEHQGKAVLYGAKVLTGWKRENGSHFWYQNLPEVKDGTWDFRALVVDGRLAERACLPEDSAFEYMSNWNLASLPAVAGRWERPPTWEELTTLIYDPKDIPADLDLKNAEVRLYHMSNESLVGIDRIDKQRHTIIFSTAPVHPPGALKKREYVILNTREGMTRPGQWYLDRPAGRIFYWPLPEKNMGEINIIAPTSEHVIRICGTQGQQVENITIRGLSLQATTAPLKSAGFGGGALDGALSIEKAVRCNIEDVEICNAGGVGIKGTDIHECRISHCHIHHTGAGGISIHRGNDLYLYNNHIHHVGRYYSSAAGVRLSGQNIHVRGNEIHEAPYSGIICGGSSHLIERNLIYKVMQVLNDGAAIYGSMKNSTVKDNLVREVMKVRDGFGVSAYYLDAGSRDCIIERNVSLGVEMPFHNNIARYTIIRDNIFVSEHDMTVSFQRSVGMDFISNRLYVPGNLIVRHPNGIRTWQDNVGFQGKFEKNIVNSGFLIDDAIPANPTKSRKEYAVEAVRVSDAPSIDGQIGYEEWPGKIQMLDRDPSRRQAGGAPVLVKFSYDDKQLHVAANVTMFAPAKVSNGSDWGQDDGIEICISGRTADNRSAVFVIRGFANGASESADVAGALKPEVVRLGKALRFAAAHSKTADGRLKGWKGEWAIPFDALGFKPEFGLKVPFNMACYSSEFGEWRCWEGTFAENWRIGSAGWIKFMAP